MIGAAVLAAGAALAHTPARTTGRELVRLQGHVGDAATVAASVRRLTLVVLGKERSFLAAEQQTFTLAEPPPERQPSERERYTLHGERRLLARFALARPEQTVTLLAERRPGSADLFVLALDLCPPE